jgi:post-segregation antitoxin (ccd killing protein)
MPKSADRRQRPWLERVPDVAAGLARAVPDKCAEVWLKENTEAIACYNSYIEKNGPPLEDFRMV